MRDCNNCICLRCENENCFVSDCKGAAVEPEFYEKAIENCHKQQCEGYKEEANE